MQQHIQILTQQLFNKSNLNEVSPDELQSLIEKYPYMGIAHWLKAKQNIQHNPTDAVKASLYSYNPTWLYFSITSAFDEPIGSKTETIEEATPVTVTPVEETSENLVSTEETKTEEKTADANPLEDQLSKIKIDLPKTEDTGLIFEPYHTIDYFASQGIKLQNEDYKDKLGKQLKSFTEWLREMKRIQPTEQAEILEKRNPVGNIDSSRSIATPEVLTETMAEVWIKQGNKLKAITIYEKLSLLYPNKKPYFAKKIEQLKDA